MQEYVQQASVDAPIIESLDYQLPYSAASVLSRSYATFQPAGAATYSGDGVRVARIAITSEKFLEGKSTFLTFRVHNKSATHLLKLSSGPHCLLQRFRVMVGGVVVEDVHEAGRVSEFLRRVVATDGQIRDDATSGGLQSRAAVDVDNVYNSYPDIQNDFIGVNQYATCRLKLCSGLLDQTKLIPLRYCGGLNVELYFQDNETPKARGVNAAVKWEVSNLEAHCALVQLDSGIDAAYSVSLQSRNVLPINYETYVTQVISVPQGATEFSVSAVRSFSKINAVFATFLGTNADANDVCTSFLNPSARIASTMGADHDEQTMEWMVSLGALQYPSQHCRSMPATLEYLKEAVRTYNRDNVEFNISKQAFKDKRFAIGVNFQSSPSVETKFDGLSSRTGDLCTLSLKSLQGAAGENAPQEVSKVYLHFRVECILEIGQGANAVLD